MSSDEFQTLPPLPERGPERDAQPPHATPPPPQPSPPSPTWRITDSPADTQPTSPSATANADATPDSTGDRLYRAITHPRLALAVGIAAVLAAAAPLLVLAGMVVRSRPRIDLVADQAVVQLTAINAGHHAQLVGPYSRFGWHHPGPSWFYLLDTAFLPLGSHGWSLVAATLLLHAVVAAAIVIVVWRHRGAVAAVLAALLVLAFLCSLPADLLSNPWNPYAIVLPAALLLLLAGHTAEASATGAAGLLIAGSFLVQTHVSTVPTVAAVVVVAAIFGGIEARRRRRDEAEPWLSEPQKRGLRDRLHLWGGVILVLLLALMWIPPALEQLNDRPGNLRAIVDFFRHNGGDHSLVDGIAAVGRDLTVFPFGHYDADLGTHLGSGRATAGLALGLFLLACAALAILGHRAKDRLARGIGAACLAATLVATWSVTRITGPVDAYLLTWVTALPLALAIGWACLLAAPGRLSTLAATRVTRGDTAPWRPAAPVLAVVAIVVTAVVLSGQVSTFAAQHPEAQSPSWAATVDDAVSAAAARLPVGAVLVSSDQYPAWPVATALTVRLVEDGRAVHVPQQWVALWGDQFAAPRNAPPPAARVLVIAPGQPGGQTPPPGASPVATADGVQVYVLPGRG